jgi:hypothetical protein
MKKRPRTFTTTIETDGVRIQNTRQEDVDEADAFSTSVPDVQVTEDPFPTDEPLSVEEIREELCCDPNTCWGCIHSFRPQRQIGKNPDADRLWDEYSRNRETLNTEACAKLLADGYDEYIYQKQLKSDPKKAIHWPYSLVLRHLKYGMMDIKTIVTQTIEMYNFLELSIAKSTLFKRGGDKNAIDFHPHKLKGLKELGETKLKYILAHEKMRSGAS